MSATVGKLRLWSLFAIWSGSRATNPAEIVTSRAAFVLDSPLVPTAWWWWIGGDCL